MGFVPQARLELTWVAPQRPKRCVSTNFTTAAILPSDTQYITQDYRVISRSSTDSTPEAVNRSIFSIKYRTWEAQTGEAA